MNKSINFISSFGYFWMDLNGTNEDLILFTNAGDRSEHVTRIWIGIFTGLLLTITLFLSLRYGLLPQRYKPATQKKQKLKPPSNVAVYKSAAVASDAGPCSEVGAKMLKRGGHAVDAAIATMLCGGLYTPQSTGIGGGTLMSIYDAKTKQRLFINGRETAPLASHKDMFKRDSKLTVAGPGVIAVPGEIAGYWEAHQRFGVLPWKDLFEDAIRLANEGVEVTGALERDLLRHEKYIRNTNRNLSPVFINSDGTLKRKGDIVKRKDLAKTLRKIADEGMDTFYRGTLADDIIADVNDEVTDIPTITKEDLEQYKVEVKPLLDIPLGDYDVLTPGTPTSGPVLALILNILKGYNFKPEDMKDTQSKILTHHRIIEAFKLAYARRTELGDEAFNEDVKTLIAKMMSPSYGEQLRLKIDDETTRHFSYYGGKYDLVPDHGTSQICILGSDGSAVSATGSINLWFGSKIRGKRTGIMFNNQMDDFASPGFSNFFGLPPSPNNFIEPGKRAMSSMVPTLVFKKSTGKIHMVTGASGGTKILTATAMSIMNNIWFKNSLQESVTMKRLHHQLYPDHILHEKDFDKEIISGLEAKNHKLQQYVPIGSVIQAIVTSPGENKMTVVCDERKGGYPDGY